MSDTSSLDARAPEGAGTDTKLHLYKLSDPNRRIIPGAEIIWPVPDAWRAALLRAARAATNPPMTEAGGGEQADASGQGEAV